MRPDYPGHRHAAIERALFAMRDAGWWPLGEVGVVDVNAAVDEYARQFDPDGVWSGDLVAASDLTPLLLILETSRVLLAARWNTEARRVAIDMLSAAIEKLQESLW